MTRKRDSRRRPRARKQARGARGATGGFRVVIPARLGSTRLPRKVLRAIAGRPMIQWVWEAACASGAREVVVATDDGEVMRACRAFGADVAMTSPRHASGTDRINEVARARRWPARAVIVNLQGDEPLLPPELVRQVAALLAADPAAHIATLCHPLASPGEWTNPNVVKVVMDARGRALYFSRAPVPWKRDGAAGEAASHFPGALAFRHLGLYAYRVAALARFSAMEVAPLEAAEGLEQLRALSNGLAIRVGVARAEPPRGVDTEDDLLAVTRLLEARGR